MSVCLCVCAYECVLMCVCLRVCAYECVLMCTYVLMSVCL